MDIQIVAALAQYLDDESYQIMQDLVAERKEKSSLHLIINLLREEHERRQHAISAILDNVGHGPAGNSSLPNPG